MKASTAIYLIGIPYASVTLYMVLKGNRYSIVLFFTAVISLWIGVFVEGIEDGEIGPKANQPNTE